MTLKHGQGYLDFVLVQETQKRLIDIPPGDFFLLWKLKDFCRHLFYYAHVILTYFAPWSIFVFMAIPFFILKRRRQESSSGEENTFISTDQGIQILFIWFFVVLCIFASMSFVINHYILVLTTPFAVITAYFLLEKMARTTFVQQTLLFLRKYLILFIVTAGMLVFSFLAVFLAGASRVWLGIFFFIYLALTGIIIKTKSPAVPAIILAVFLAIIFCQSSLLGKAGLTSHAILQNFARTIHNDPSQDYLIGVGSYDIHEKEFQVYFDKKVQKLAQGQMEDTRRELTNFMKSRGKTYCLLTEKDMNDFLTPVFGNSFQIVQQEYIFKRRLRMDKHFLKSLLNLRQKEVASYFFEKVVLIKKEQNV